MKIKFQYLAIALFGLFVATATSCKKKDNEPVCRVSSILTTNLGGSDLQSITYADGKLAKVEYNAGNDGTATYAYNGNTIIITYTSATGTVNSTTTVTLNSFGLVDKTIVQFPGSATPYRTNSYTYSASGQLQANSYKVQGGSGTFTYEFTNGDMTTFREGNNAYVYTYDVSKPLSDNDPQNFDDILYNGAYIYRDSHQMKSYISGSHDTTNYSYQYDASGRVSKVTSIQRGSTNYITDYQYTCN